MKVSKMMWLSGEYQKKFRVYGYASRVEFSDEQGR
jgi:hypothetical protein